MYDSMIPYAAPVHRRENISLNPLCKQKKAFRGAGLRADGSPSISFSQALLASMAHNDIPISKI